MATNIILTMEGTLLNWLKNVGDSVNAGDIVAEIEADKATVEVEAPTAGVIIALNAQVGDELTEGAVIGSIGAAGEAAATDAPEKSPAAAQPAAAEKPTAQPVTPAAEVPTDGRIKVSPVARNVAAERGINLSLVQGTGPGGRIVKADVENFQPTAAAPQAAAPVASGISAAPVRKLPEGADVEIVDITKMRSRIGASTTESKQHIPHFYVTSEVSLDALLKFRSQINSSVDEGGVKVSVNDMIVKAAALALRQFPNLNTHHYGEKLVVHKRINVATAVALSEGVIYVVAKDADKLSLSELATLNKGLVSRAREGKIKPEDIRDGTFSVSNLGPFDVDHFIAIINPPEAAVLAVGSGVKQPVVLADGTIGIETRMKATVSADHRVTDGAEAAQFLQAFKALIENPMRLV